MNINRVEMKKDPNGIWEMNVYTDTTPNIPMEEIAHIEDSHYHYGESAEGIVRFGVSYDEDYLGHKPGYMWSSRCGVFNTAFGKELIDITLCTPNGYGDITRWGCYYMTLEAALELMPNDFHISEFDAYDERVYHFIKNGEPDEYFGYDFIAYVIQLREEE